MPEGYVVDETASINGMDKEADLQKEVKSEEPDEWGF